MVMDRVKSCNEGMRPILGRPADQQEKKVSGEMGMLMTDEVRSAVSLLQSYMPNKVPRRKIGLFGEQLANLMLEYFNCQLLAFIEGNTSGSPDWHQKVQMFLKPLDGLMKMAVHSVGIPLSDVIDCLPAEFEMILRPGKVFYRQSKSARFQKLQPDTCIHQSISVPVPVTELQLNTGSKRDTDSSVFRFMTNTNIDYTVGSFSKTRFGSVKEKSERIGKTIQVRDQQQKGAVLHL